MCDVIANRDLTRAVWEELARRNAQYGLLYSVGSDVTEPVWGVTLEQWQSDEAPDPDPVLILQVSAEEEIWRCAGACPIRQDVVEVMNDTTAALERAVSIGMALRRACGRAVAAQRKRVAQEFCGEPDGELPL